jgi:hypothetical protein
MIARCLIFTWAVLGLLELGNHHGATAMTDKKTGISFADKVNGLGIFGVGVRAKGPISVYSVACYGPKGVDKALSLYSLSTKGDAAKAMKTLRTEVPKGPATFVLKFCMKVGAEKISSAIADSVASRCSGSSEVASLKAILQSGMTGSGDGGGTKKGTTMQFDCARGGVTVSLDGKRLGTAKSGGLSKAFCNVYMDDKAVSPALRQSCLDNLCQP